MASTYTTNLGIEKIADGEQSETWGDTTNTNFDLIDQGINGIISITLASAGNSGSPNDLPITDGTVSNGRNKFIEFTDGGDLGATAYVQLTPNDAEKMVFIRNSLSASRSLIVFQGTYNASNDFEIANGKDVVLKFDGAGAGATVTQVFNDLSIAGITAAAGTFTTLTAAGLTTSGDINFGDNDKAVFGAGSDLQIFHSGGQSLIDDVGTGQLTIRSNGTDIRLADSSNNRMLIAKIGAEVELYHNAIAKLATTSTGVTVTGTVAATTYTGDGSNLTGISAGATGGGDDQVFYENDQTVDTDYTITTNKNAMTAGPITVSSGVSVTVPSGSTWIIV